MPVYTLSLVDVQALQQKVAVLKIVTHRGIDNEL
jgi:hypothetical protein